MSATTEADMSSNTQPQQLTLIERVHNLPPELFLIIKEEVFAPPPAVARTAFHNHLPTRVIVVDDTYHPPSLLSVSRTTQQTYSQDHYANHDFLLPSEGLLFRWLRFLSVAHRTQVSEARVHILFLGPPKPPVQEVGDWVTGVSNRLFEENLFAWLYTNVLVPHARRGFFVPVEESVKEGRAKDPENDKESEEWLHDWVSKAQTCVGETRSEEEGMLEMWMSDSSLDMIIKTDNM